MYVVIFLWKSFLKYKFALFTKSGELLILTFSLDLFTSILDWKLLSEANIRTLDDYGYN